MPAAASGFDQAIEIIIDSDAMPMMPPFQVVPAKEGRIRPRMTPDGLGRF
jgi:hypothetical protein